MMTKDEALRGLTIGDCRTRREAVKTVRELLNREECEDTISRRAVLDICDKYNGQGYVWTAIRGEVEHLPSVNPQYTEAELQKMQELEQAEIEKAYELGMGEKQESEDAISRKQAIYVASGYCHPANVARELAKLPPVTPQPKTGHCKDCKYFEYDSVAKVDGIPLIVAHEICKRWGDGCKTKEDGYCFMFEPQERNE